MELQSILKADYLDIIFDNRNKTYGGYELRKNYERRTMKAITLVLSAALLLIGAHAIASNFEQQKPTALHPVERVIEMQDLTPHIPDPPPPPVPPTPAPPAPSVVWTPPVITPDIDVPEPPVTQEDLKNKNPGTENSDGDPNGIPGPPAIPGNGNAPGFVEPPVIREDVIQEYVEQMPEFDGNISEYLSRNIQYPPAAREANISGRVVIKFVVNEDGSISGAKVMKGIGGGCEEEAMRVINGMPKWRAGKANGKAVKVYFTLPVRFTMSN
jgi:protein TonB